MIFHLDGEPLKSEYDEVEDILYLWVGDQERPAITYETDDGHLVRLDPETDEFVGVTILDYRERWERQNEIALQVPHVKERRLQPVL
jgi:uncharacterized protein DUF2283